MFIGANTVVMMKGELNKCTVFHANPVE